MSVAIRTEVVGGARLAALYARLDIKKNPAPVGRALRRIALETQRIATGKIRRGGSLRPAPTVLTSRTGTGRRSIATDFSSLPFTAVVGSDLAYMAVHETGGTVNKPASQVSAHTRTVVFGRTVAPFQVPGYTRGAHTATYPPRPFLGPAVDDMVPGRAQTIIVEEWEREA